MIGDLFLFHIAWLVICFCCI